MASAPAVNGELKEELAVDAAADPSSPVTAQQAEKVILDESKKAGAVAMQFDPDASPEEKAAQAKAVRSSIQPLHCTPSTDLQSMPTIRKAHESPRAWAS